MYGLIWGLSLVPNCRPRRLSMSPFTTLPTALSLLLPEYNFLSAYNEVAGASRAR
jgi:hypothetical protein